MLILANRCTSHMTPTQTDEPTCTLEPSCAQQAWVIPLVPPTLLRFDRPLSRSDLCSSASSQIEPTSKQRECVAATALHDTRIHRHHLSTTFGVRPLSLADPLHRLKQRSVRFIEFLPFPLSSRRLSCRVFTLRRLCVTPRASSSLRISSSKGPCEGTLLSLCFSPLARSFNTTNKQPGQFDMSYSSSPHRESHQQQDWTHPPSTDGPNTRARRAQGLPLYSGRSAPLPSLQSTTTPSSIHPTASRAPTYTAEEWRAWEEDGRRREQENRQWAQAPLDHVRLLQSIKSGVD